MKLKKLLAIGLAVVTIAASLTACGDGGQTPADTNQEGQAPAGDDDQTTAGDDGSEAPSGDSFKVGYNLLGPGDFALDTLAGNQAHVIESFGDTCQVMNDDFQVDKIVQDIENMISSGCDGIVIWLPADNLYQTVIDKCTEAKVPFVFSDKIPNDPAMKEALMDNEYFVGAVGPANAEYGSLIAQYALDKGYKSCLITTGNQGDPTDTPRIEAFKEVFEAGGGKIEQIVYCDSTDIIQQNTENALLAYPDIDFIYGSGSEYANGACEAVDNQSMDVKVLTSGLENKALEYLEDGTYMEFLNGDYWISGTIATLLLENYLHGNPIKDADGKPVWIDDIMPFEVPADMFGDFKATFIDKPCYSSEEIAAMNGISYDELMDIVNSYSLEERIAASK